MYGYIAAEDPERHIIQRDANAEAYLAGDVAECEECRAVAERSLDGRPLCRDCFLSELESRQNVREWMHAQPHPICGLTGHDHRNHPGAVLRCKVSQLFIKDPLNICPDCGGDALRGDHEAGCPDGRENAE